MAELPKVDPVKLYQKALIQVRDLNDQALQMDTLIEMLVEERDRAFEERDKAQAQLLEYTGKLAEATAAARDAEKAEEPVLEGTVVK